MLTYPTHTCNDCGNETVYHAFPHESEGDTVVAFCEQCGRDTNHTIGSEN